MSQIIMTSLLLCVVTIGTRFIPFWFQVFLKDNQYLDKVGHRLPAFIIALLVFFEVGPKTFTIYPFGLPSCLALSMLVLIHLWKRQVLLSMLAGLVSYLLMLPYFH